MGLGAFANHVAGTGLGEALPDDLERRAERGSIPAGTLVSFRKALGAIQGRTH